MFSPGIPPSVLRARRAELDEGRAFELLKATHLREEVKRDPTLRREIELEAWQKLQVRRHYAFEDMEDSALRRCSFLNLRSHKLFWAWRKQAKMELQQLRETEQSSKERMAQIMDAFLLARENEARDPYTFDDSTDTSVLPITTPAAFALKYTPEHRPWFQSGARESILPSACPPGKRFSLCEILQIPCKPEHYRWLNKSVGPGLIKDSGSGDRTPQKRLGLWPHLAKLMWRDKVGASHVVGD